MPKKKIPPVYIEFLDHCSDPSWLTQEELDKHNVVTLYALGWLVRETKNQYKVCLELTENGDVGDTMAIIKKSVTKFIYLDIANQIK